MYCTVRVLDCTVPYFPVLYYTVLDPTLSLFGAVYYGLFAICFNGLAAQHIIPVGGPLLVFKKREEDKANEDML